MCGIFGYIGNRDPLTVSLAGLEQLEYRGYDSTGIAGISRGKVVFCKEAGKLAELKKVLNLSDLDLAIGHTRWATHGKVTSKNAHPHLDSKQSLALVHNGIIENHDLLKEDLKKLGHKFISETDSEVIAQLVAEHYNGDLVEALQMTLPLLKGHFAIALIHKDHPDQIVATARECPLSIGYNDLHSESIISSDPNALLGSSLNILFLRNDEIAKVEKGKVQIIDRSGTQILKELIRLNSQIKSPSKEGFEHFMLKEIFEQPNTVQKALLGRIVDHKVQFESLSEDFRNASHVWFIGCGTSSLAGNIGTQFLEDIAQIPATCEIASEARYRVIPKETLVIAISQSGETADTISAVREIRSRGHKVLGICNVNNSTLTRETDGCIFLNAGPEVSVCSTKAFTSQIAVLYLLAFYMAKKEIPKEFLKVHEQLSQVLEKAPKIQQIAKKYSQFTNFFFMGRRYMFPTCMEAALKLKEISYVNANGYPAGEIKHGPIALIDENFPVIAFCSNKQTEDKIMSNLQEVKAREAPILAFAPESLKSIIKIADDVIYLPDTMDELSPFTSSVAGQLFAYYVAKERGCDIDQPRNLAKSVTVE